MRTRRTEENATRTGGRFSISQTVLIKLAPRDSSVRRKSRTKLKQTATATTTTTRTTATTENLCAIAIIIALPAHNQNIKQLTKAAQHSRAEHDDSHALSLYRTGRATSSTLYYSVTCARSLAHTQAHKCLISIGIFWRWRCCGVNCEWQMGVRENKKKQQQKQRQWQQQRRQLLLRLHIIFTYTYTHTHARTQWHAVNA